MVNSSIHHQPIIAMILRVDQQRLMNSYRRRKQFNKILNQSQASRFKKILSPCKNKRREKTAFSQS